MVLSSFTVSAQSQLSKEEATEVRKKMFESSEKINTVVYKIDCKKKRLSDNDTVYTTAICSLYINPKDRLKAYHIVDKESTSSGGKGYAHTKYDGKRTFNFNRLVDSLDVYKEPYIDEDKRMVQVMVQNYSYLLLGEYFALRKPSDKGNSQAESIVITEEMFKDTMVYCVTIDFKDNEGARDRVGKIYISKSDYLPVAGSAFGKWETMEEYDDYEIEYLAINPDISLENFKIDKNETINPVERYRTFKEKVKGLESIN